MVINRLLSSFVHFRFDVTEATRNKVGRVNLGDPVLIFHEEFAGATSKSLAIVVLETESDGGRDLLD